MTGKDDFDLQYFLPYLLNQAAEEASIAFQKVYKSRYGMLRTEWRVLFHLGRYGAMTATDIGERARIHKTKVSRAVAALEKRDLIVRDKNRDDQREQTLCLSDQGNAMYEEIVPQALAYSKSLEDALTEEQKSVLDEIFDRLHEATRSGEND